MIELPDNARLWGNAFDPSRLPETLRPALSRRVAAGLGWAAELGCALWVSPDLGWAERLVDTTGAHRKWAPLRRDLWRNADETTTVLIAAPIGARNAVASICVRHLWIEGTLSDALATGFGTNADGESIRFDGDLGRVADVGVAWACGLWRADQLRGARIGAELVGLAALQAVSQWPWSWLMGLRRQSAQDRLGLSPFRRLEAPCRTADTSDLMLVAASRAQVKAGVSE